MSTTDIGVAERDVAPPTPPMRVDAVTNPAESFRPPWWLRGAHLQTIVPALFAPRARVAYVRERWDTPDGDFIDVDRVRSSTPASAVLIVFHGLESDTRSRYVRGLMAEAVARGWHGVAPHFRSCGGTINHLPRFYHSGDSDEIDWIVRRVAREFAAESALPLVVAGVSLGGNMLLKWLGERGAVATSLVRAAAAVSAPLDLAAGGAVLERGFNRFYTWLFLRTLKAKSRIKLTQHAALFDRTRMERSRTFHAFDDVVTAPLHGFIDADDYWRQASSRQWLPHIVVPTLILNAKNDPFLPASALPGADDVSPAVTLELPDDGGHVGFVAAGPGGAAWMPRRVTRFLANVLAQRAWESVTDATFDACASSQPAKAASL